MHFQKSETANGGNGMKRRQLARLAVGGGAHLLGGTSRRICGDVHSQ